MQVGVGQERRLILRSNIRLGENVLSARFYFIFPEAADLGFSQITISRLYTRECGGKKCKIYKKQTNKQTNRKLYFCEWTYLFNERGQEPNGQTCSS